MDPEPEAKPAKKKCTVYIDGFNAYYGVFKLMPQAKWLNIQRFWEHVLSREEVTAVKYFTAAVDQDKPTAQGARQAVYLAALRTLPKVRTILGTYQNKSVRCLARCQEEYSFPEEKKTDVNIAVHMIDDAMSGSAESIALVSADSDLQPAMAFIQARFPNVAMRVFFPLLPEVWKHRRIDFYTQRKIPCGIMPIAPLASCLLPDPVMNGVGQALPRPASWK